VQYIVHALQDVSRPGVQEGVLSMLYKVAEDFPFQLTLDLQIGRPAAPGGQPTVTKPVDVAMELIAPLFAAADAEVRYQAVRTFNMLVPLMPQWLVTNIDGYVHGLLALASSNADARIHRVRPHMTTLSAPNHPSVSGFAPRPGPMQVALAVTHAPKPL
jgi:hypothetical protein